MRPRILVVDEPTTGQDQRQSYEVMNFLRELNKAGTTIVIITHSMRLVAEYARRVIVMSQGRIIANSTAKDIFSRADVLKEAHLKPPQITQLASQLNRAGIGVDGMSLSVEELAKGFVSFCERKA